MARRALAYTSDVILGRTGEVISRAAQREAIRRHAAENDIEIAGWFEDEAYNADVLAREGVHRLLDCLAPGDTVLVERVWSLSRRWPVLEPFLAELQRRGARLESAAWLWDCISQRARHFGTERKPAQAWAPEAVPAEAARPVAIEKPDRLFFADLVHRHA